MPAAPAVAKARNLQSDGGKAEDPRLVLNSMLRSTVVLGSAVSAITNSGIKLRSLENTPAQRGVESSEREAALDAEGGCRENVYDAEAKQQTSKSSMQPHSFITRATSRLTSLFDLTKPQSTIAVHRQQKLPRRVPRSSTPSNSPATHHIREAPHPLLQARQSLPSGSSVSPEKASQNNAPSMNVIITIVLAVIAGVAVLSLVILLIYTRLRRRRSRRRSGGDPRPQSHVHKDIRGQHTGETIPVPLTLPNIVSLPPLSPSLPPFALTPTSQAHDDITATSRDEILRPPSRLENRRFHQSTKSDSSIQPGSTTMGHTRWGKPLSMSILSSSGPGRQALDDRLNASSWENRFHDPRLLPSIGIGSSTTYARQVVPALQLSHKATLSTSTASSMASQAGYNGKSLTSTTSHRTHKTAASASTMTSITSRAGHQGQAPLSPPQTPRKSDYPASPGPPPSRALPSPPLKSWQVNPLSLPVEADMEDVSPEEIGIAVSSIPGIPTPMNTPVRPDFKMSLGSPRNFSSKDSRPREKRPRLSEQDMEKLGGTYSSFKR